MRRLRGGRKGSLRGSLLLVRSVHMRVSRILTELSEHAAQGAASRATVEPEDKRLGGGVRGALVVPVEEVLVTERMWGARGVLVLPLIIGSERDGGGDWLGDW